jgi:hypothetical protein
LEVFLKGAKKLLKIYIEQSDAYSEVEIAWVFIWQITRARKKELNDKLKEYK